MSRIEEVQQLLLVVLAERGANTHMAHYGARYAGREPFRRRVTTRAILLKDALALGLRLTDLLMSNGLSGR